MINLGEYINESLEEIYHFTNTDNLLELIKDDVFLTSSDDGYNPKEYKYYISTTRVKNANIGYPTGMLNDKIVRICLNVDILKSKYKVKPVDWGHAKEIAIKKNWPAGEKDFDKNKHEILKQTNVESEERVYTNDEEIKQFSKYIKRIDVYTEWFLPVELDRIKEYCQTNGIQLVEYSDEKKFKLGK